MNSNILFFLRRHVHFILLAGLFALLLARNPFGVRTQIPNFEPYPDSFHYIVPARSILAGTGPYLTREGRHFNPSVPIVYSLTLIPFFLIHNDPRMFYFANVVFSFMSFALLYVILRKLSIRRSIQCLILFLFASNFYMYWYPSLAMAETLTTAIVLLCLLLLIIRITPLRAAAMALLAVALYFTKYANIPLTVSLGLLYSVKLFFPLKAIQSRRTAIVAFLCVGIGSFSAFSLWEYFFYGRSQLATVVGALFSKPVVATTTDGKQSSGPGFFSTSYIPDNLRFYLPMVFGLRTKMLWVFTPLLSKFVAIPAIASLVSFLFARKTRFIAASLLLIIFSNVAFLSTFYAPDARYFVYIIPSLLIGLALILNFLSSFLVRRHLAKLFIVGVTLCIGIALVLQAKPIKNQISLNLRHAETPWYYISVLELNQAVDDLHLENKPVVISALPPFLVDFYSGNRYTLLPLHAQQEFRGDKAAVFGPYDYSDLHALYRSQLESGKTVLVEKYGLGNEAMLQSAFTDLSKDFSMIPIHDGCHNLCTVYELKLKK